MAKQRIVNTHFWRDGYILTLTPNERLVFLWVITNPATDLCGAYEVAIPIIELETGLKARQLFPIFEKFQSDGKIMYRDGWVVIRNFLKHQSGTSTNIKKGAARSLSACPDWIKDTLSKGIVTTPYRALPEPEPEPEPEPKGLTLTAAPAREIFIGKVLAGVMKELTVKKISVGAEKEWESHAGLAFENGFKPEDFIACFADLRSKHSYRIRPEYVTDRLPDFVKNAKKRKTSALPTIEEKLADDAVNRAAMKAPPKTTDIETIQ